MFIIGAIPDSLIYMKKKQKGYKFKEEDVKKMHATKKSFWSKATGGRMK